MAGISTEEIEAYLDGELCEARRGEIARLTRTDPELAAKIAVIAHLSGIVSIPAEEGPVGTRDGEPLLPGGSPGEGRGTAPRKWSMWSRWPRVVVAAAVLLVAAGVLVLGGSLYQAEAANAELKVALARTSAELADTKQALRHDTFDSGWLDPRKWKTGRRKTTALDGYARLNDRGSLVTVEEFPSPVEVRLEWRWIDLAGDVAYRDTLTVALHTSGEHAERHPFRVTDGIEVTLQTHSGQVSIASFADRSINPTSPEGALPMPAGKWHRLRIVDDGKAIAVYLSGPAIDRKHDGKPVLRAPYKGSFAKHHVAIYNREPVAGTLHESHVRNVAIVQRPEMPK